MDAETVIARALPILGTHPGLVAAYLFGSVARGTAKASSDVDIAVLYAERPPSVLGSPPMKLEGALERELHCPVQVVCLNVAPPDLAIRVLRGGRLILERDRAARIRFEGEPPECLLGPRARAEALPQAGDRDPVTDPALVAKRLNLIEAYVRELRTLAKPEELRRDIREQRFILHTLQLAAQAALDVASHIVSDERLGEPDTYRELFGLLARHRWIESALASKLEDMAGFRNVVVHGYADVDLNVVEDVVKNHLDDLLAFARAIRTRVP